MDINTKKLMKNAFRVTKERGHTASRIRIPGGHLDVTLLPFIQEIAQKYGNGTIHITVRQGLEIPGIKFEDIPKVNALLQPIISGIATRQEAPGTGYPASGTRNVSACIGNRVCPYACYDTTGLAQRIEDAVYPNDLHFKIALTGCPNDCAKVRMHDFGIIGMTLPQFDSSRCASCGACERYCRKKSVGAISMVNNRPNRSAQKCVGCGECVINCPTRAWTRSKEQYFRLVLLGRTGKRNPRLAVDFIKWTDADSIIKIITNTYDYVKEYIDPSAPGGKEHIGYIVDRTGVQEYLKWAMKDVKLPSCAEIEQTLYWGGPQY
ncbi:anaerobic sulfite reductase subunit C [Sporobacter termitidis DSM 10068]|uniref:Anaerobic sulfite reductase subunit C n=1 Tax=Sporobacter termitidis DSM 10068 TaxID=1123282 RepID=A0A1M5YSC9_9FIRM|nr:sulfite reductase subunit C [Sporobacter termitidis]SHI14774.1 anaerobic sulfite reductase subunit C [Sporobacter termitidis DSM 10068]